MYEQLTISEFIALKHYQYLLLDVRSPAEYTHAHIPSAHNLPLFTNNERAQVGTAYKQVSRQAAIKIGLTYFGPKLNPIIIQVETLLSKYKKPEKVTIVVHCWRGGMRSAAVAWLLNLYGFKVAIITGGYKQYRNWALAQFELPYKFIVLGGYTGSGKTEILEALEKMGQPVINFEKLAKHKGSAYGNLDLLPQPSQEMFENQLAMQLYHNKNNTTWIEDESQRIGTVQLPNHIFALKQEAQHYFIIIPFEARLQFIVTQYGKYTQEKLINATIRIKKRLGGLETKNVINHLIENDLTNAFGILLTYYDKEYTKGMQRKEGVMQNGIQVTSLQVHDSANAQLILLTLNKDNV